MAVRYLCGRSVFILVLMDIFLSKAKDLSAPLRIGLLLFLQIQRHHRCRVRSHELTSCGWSRKVVTEEIQDATAVLSVSRQEMCLWELYRTGASQKWLLCSSSVRCVDFDVFSMQWANSLCWWMPEIYVECRQRIYFVFNFVLLISPSPGAIITSKFSLISLISLHLINWNEGLFQAQ
jgi:hypothetical protein